jgi:hypothetical protein
MPIESDCQVAASKYRGKPGERAGLRSWASVGRNSPNGSNAMKIVHFHSDGGAGRVAILQVFGPSDGQLYGPTRP